MPERSTLIDTAEALGATTNLEAANSTVGGPVGAAASAASAAPALMFTVASRSAPKLAPEALINATLNARLPGSVLASGTRKLLGVEAPLAQLKLPEVAL